MITTDLINRAKKYAIKAHGDQKYSDEFPYALHLQAVESVLIRFGVWDEELRVAAWLHDVLEDVPGTTAEELLVFFPERSVKAVVALTEPSHDAEGNKLNRKQRHLVTYPKIRTNPDAIIVKLADRIANVESGGRQIQMYKKEHKDFKDALFRIDLIRDDEWFLSHGKVISAMWDYLDDLLIQV